MSKISVIAKRPHSKPYHTNVENSLLNLQHWVGGYIEVFKIASDMAIICNEEGKLWCLPHNCTVMGEDFVGDILFVGVDGEDFCDIPIEWKQFKRLFSDLFKEE